MTEPVENDQLGSEDVRLHSFLIPDLIPRGQLNVVEGPVNLEILNSV